MIRVLEKNIADKIAAGEVIERPVSVIKELVENAVDSGADSITVEIRSGGKKYMRVTDNGCGIPSVDAETAFLRHATSKIETVKDLDAIETLGFRGEALASIAAVTHTELVSKTADEKVGIKLIIHGSEVISSEGTGCPDGTTIVVTDLFYNTPARLKFLKSDSAESGQIIDFMSRIALAYSDIRFRFINNGNTVFSTSGKGNLQHTILAVYKINEYKDLVPVDFTDGKNKVYGFISSPSLSKTSRRNQIFFVNGRTVNSKVMEKGVDDGYRERLFEGRYPVVFLFVETSPERLDVNIHPNKKEVRFDDEKEIFNLISTGIKEALGSKAAVIQVKNPFKEDLNLTNDVKKEKQEQVDIKQILSTKIRNPEILTFQDYEQKTIEPVKAIENTSVSEKICESEPELKDNQYKINDVREEYRQMSQQEINVAPPFDFDELTFTGSIFGTYITAVDDKNFYMIDQHAAHERVFYEKLVNEYLASEKLHQPILTPILLEVSPYAAEKEEEWSSALSEMGFTIELFGPTSYVIREIPTFMTLSEAESFAGEFIENIGDKINLNNTVVIDKLIMKSCKSAVKAHDYLSEEEIEALIQQLKQCRNPFSCPHGRPTFIKFSQYEIEKMFKRV